MDQLVPHPPTGTAGVGAVVASGAAPLDRIELSTSAPVRLPGVLEVLGDFAFDAAGVRLRETRHPYDPLQC